MIFPVKYLIRSVPQPLDAPVPEPDLSTPEKRGEYLVTIAGCTYCHTPQDDHGQPLPGMDFGGGLHSRGPVGPRGQREYHAGSIGDSLLRSRHSLRRRSVPATVKARPLNQIMPWHVYRGMTDEDLAAVFAYLKTLKPVQHHVDNTEPPTFCKICGQTHGGGNQN